MRSLFKIMATAIVGALLLSCGHGDDTSNSTPGPAITSFLANTTTIANGETVNLTGIFVNGTGIIMPGDLSVNSGDVTGVTPSVTSPYTLTVTGTDGVTTVSQGLTITVVPAGTAVTVAGTAGTNGSANGTGVGATFDGPLGVAVDSTGNVYVTDSNNNTIRKIAPSGTVAVEVSTLAGTAGTTGSADGTGAAASFYQPSGIAVDTSGNIYVADTLNGTIRKITPGGVVTTLAGTPGTVGSSDGTGAAASFDRPNGLAVDSLGNVYVADFGNNTIRAVSPAGAVSTFAGTPGVRGSADGTGAAASFYQPSFLAMDSASNLYVTDSGNNTVRRITPAGVVSTVAGTAGIAGSSDGSGPGASFYGPTGIALDASGNIYVADCYNYTIRTILSPNVVITIAGTVGIFGSDDGTGSSAAFYCPSGLAADYAGNIYVADFKNDTVRRVTR